MNTARNSAYMYIAGSTFCQSTYSCIHVLSLMLFVTLKIYYVCKVYFSNVVMCTGQCAMSGTPTENAQLVPVVCCLDVQGLSLS